MDSNAGTRLQVVHWGLRPYDEVWAMQRAFHERLIAGLETETLLIGQHFPTITCGTSSKDEHLHVSEQELQEAGIVLRKVERGGDVTYHGPGQVVAYPILDLNLHRRDVGWFMRSLEECVIRSLSDYGIVGERIPGKTGVWIEPGSPRKIASLGVKLSRWRSYHGISLNVAPQAQGFSYIDACGFKSLAVTSVGEELQRMGSGESQVSCEQVETRFVWHFRQIFGLPEEREVTEFTQTNIA